MSEIPLASAQQIEQQVSYQLQENDAVTGEVNETSVTERIVTVFNACFSPADGLNTWLKGGFEEPFYRPAGDGQPFHQVEFTRDYPASALHEVAHWCVAGARRRQLPDYGYWYAPDGRSPEQQAEFEIVEVKPQAIEWIFARACGLKFRVSADNLGAGLGPSAVFKLAIWQQARRYCEEGANSRVRQFAESLAQAFGRPDPLCVGLYRLEDLG
ncbi:elongation factor P hydroxylase [Microbulbifer bruguierae]|uniref:Elongation factor P hydroxylase n=1 Tax=Microbulbifer bruguierae TaxID=3029061 RepID=A0ABY8NHC5_9GAMM|nr:elongation factor P hydroxylase [Microbulbifer bruguierae]WGL17467.1 elongation factor P hydroxylase [Microbulbifer bruguierae]